MQRALLETLGLIIIATSIVSCSSSDNTKGKQYPVKFTNSESKYKSELGDLLKITKAYFTTERLNPTPTFELPVHAITKAQLSDEQQDVIYRLGHSSLAMKIDQQFILTDPIFSERASPVQWAGPKRFHQPPISLKDLPSIDVVLISHDHYDHLDKASVKTLVKKVSVFLVPLKIGQILREWGVPEDKIIELNWWEAYVHNGVEYILTPSQHFSGRGFTDRDSTLWGSWVINGQNNKVFFSGDSGYFSGFKEIGQKYGPFDFTMIEMGAYNTLWADIHMFPEQSIQAHIDLKGKVMMPIHNGTFDLALHDWNEPMQKAMELSDKRGIKIVLPEFGQKVKINDPVDRKPWWI